MTSSSANMPKQIVIALFIQIALVVLTVFRIIKAHSDIEVQRMMHGMNSIFDFNFVDFVSFGAVGLSVFVLILVILVFFQNNWARIVYSIIMCIFIIPLIFSVFVDFTNIVEGGVTVLQIALINSKKSKQWLKSTAFWLLWNVLAIKYHFIPFK